MEMLNSSFIESKIERIKPSIKILLFEDTKHIAEGVISEALSFKHSIEWVVDGKKNETHDLGAYNVIFVDRDNSLGTETDEFHTYFFRNFDIYCKTFKEKSFSNAKEAIKRIYPFSAERLNNKYLIETVIRILGDNGFFNDMTIEEIRQEMPQLESYMSKNITRKDIHLKEDLSRIF